MTVLRTTLLCDGSSDQALIPILDWLLQQKISRMPLARTQWANFGFLRAAPENLEERIRLAVEHYPADLFFIHRDAEGQDPDDRKKEIQNAIRQANPRTVSVCVIPVRMTEPVPQIQTGV